MEQRIRGGLILLIALVSQSSFAEQANEPDPNEGFKFKPIFLDAKGATGLVFGVSFEYKKAWEKVAGFNKLVEEKAPTRAADAKSRGLMSCGGYAEEQGKTTPTWISFTDCAGEISAKGTATADTAKNPNKLVDFSGSYSWIYTTSSRAGTNMFALGGQAKYETDQSFENKQFVFGLRGSFTNLLGCGAAGAGQPCNNMNFLGLSVGLQRVDPSKDNGRKKALAGALMENYQRLELEGFYKLYLPKEWRSLSDIEFNYRHFQELNPSDVVRQAGLHRNRLGLVRLNFGIGGSGATAFDPKMFVQYSRGSLPFDTKSERVVKIGLQVDVF